MPFGMISKREAQLSTDGGDGRLIVGLGEGIIVLSGGGEELAEDFLPRHFGVQQVFHEPGGARGQSALLLGGLGGVHRGDLPLRFGVVPLGFIRCTVGELARAGGVLCCAFAFVWAGLAAGLPAILLGWLLAHTQCVDFLGAEVVVGVEEEGKLREDMGDGKQV